MGGTVGKLRVAVVASWAFQRLPAARGGTAQRKIFHLANWSCCCCLPTPPCLLEGVLPYFEVTGHPVPVSSLGFKCPDCFLWNCNYIVYPSKMKGPYRDNCLRYY